MKNPTTQPLISAIICTYGRATPLKDLLASLESQSYPNFEVLVVDGNEEPSPARQGVDDYVAQTKSRLNIAVVTSNKGLTRQRNVGLRSAKGDLICFFDDDVTFAPDFFLNLVAIFRDPHLQNVGGLTPYDTLHYPIPVTLRWRLRALLGVMPGLDPGRIDRLGRAVPISFLKPWPGRKQVGWLPGFCMIYRRTAIEGLWFDELLPTYAGEDRDFSMRVAHRNRLLICGDLHVKHHYTVEGRDDSLNRLRESSFGAGRRFAKYSRGFRDCPVITATIAGDLIVDLVALVRSPSLTSFLTPFVRIQACFEGLRSARIEDLGPKEPTGEMRFVADRIPVRVADERDS